MLAEVIPTRQLIFQRVNKGDYCCVLCGFEVESSLHIFKECHVVRLLDFARKWGCKMNFLNIYELEQLIELCISPSKNDFIQGETSEWFTTFLASLFYNIWRCRSKVLFEGKFQISHEISFFENSVEEFSSSILNGINSTAGPSYVTERNLWEPPTEGWIKINTDASFKDGNAAFAMVVRDSRRNLLYAASKLGKSSNPHLAEIKAINWASSYSARC